MGTPSRTPHTYLFLFIFLFLFVNNLKHPAFPENEDFDVVSTMTALQQAMEATMTRITGIKGIQVERVLRKHTRFS